MLLVASYLAPSTIHGIGVFAANFIPANTIIWEFNAAVDWRMTADDVAAFPEPYRSAFTAYIYVDDEGYYVLCGDNARYFNHSATPNCDDAGAYTRTLRDIQAGEELTCDYFVFDEITRQHGLEVTSFVRVD